MDIQTIPTIINTYFEIEEYINEYPDMSVQKLEYLLGAKNTIQWLFGHIDKIIYWSEKDE